MAQPREQTQKHGDSNNYVAMIAFYLLGGHCACFWPFTRHSFGKHGIGIEGLAAFAIQCFFMAAFPCPDMLVFLVPWCLLLFAHRMHTLVMYWRGWRPLTRYDGYPWLAAMLFPVRTDYAAKAYFEPLLLLGAGWLAGQWSEGLGVFIGSGAVSLLVKKSFEGVIEMRMEDAANDNRIRMMARAQKIRR